MSIPEIITVLGGRVRLLQAPKGFRTCMDSVVMSSACPAKAGERVLDLGCGVGGASLCVLARVPQAHVTGIDIQDDHIDLAKENAAANNMAACTSFVNEHVQRFQTETLFDHVICNPPYLEDGAHLRSPSASKAQAHGMDVDLKIWVDCGFHALRNGGSFTMINRADKLDKIVQGLGKRFGAVEIFPLWPKCGVSAKRVVVRALKNRKTPATIHAGLVLHQDNGDYTSAANIVLREGKALW